VYSLGCVLLTLITGRAPFDADGVGEIIAMHLREPAPLASSVAPGIPSAVDDLIARCLAKDPAQRYGSAGELATAISRIHPSGVSGSQVALPAAPPAHSLPTTLSSVAGSQVVAPARSRKPWLLGGAAAVIGGVFAFAIIASASSESTGGPPGPGIAVPRPVARPEPPKLDPPKPAPPPAPIEAKPESDPKQEPATVAKPVVVPQASPKSKRDATVKKPSVAKPVVEVDSDGIPTHRAQ
jgi:serine/threonine protein kinase